MTSQYSAGPYGTIVRYSAYRGPDSRIPPLSFYDVGRVSGADYAPGYVSVVRLATTYPEGSEWCKYPHSTREAHYAPEIVDEDRLWRG